MIQITKIEADYIRGKYPEVCIAKTRHKRYLEESLRYLKALPDNKEAAKLVAEAEKRRNSRL